MEETIKAHFKPLTVKYLDPHLSHSMELYKKVEEPWKSIIGAAIKLYSVFGPVVRDLNLVYLAAGSDISPAILPARKVVYVDINPREEECMRLKRPLEKILNRKIEIKYVITDARDFVKTRDLKDSIVLSFSLLLSFSEMLEVILRDKPPVLGFYTKTIEGILFAVDKEFADVFRRFYYEEYVASVEKNKEEGKALYNVLKENYFLVERDLSINIETQTFWKDQFPGIGKVDIQFYPLSECFFVRKDLIKKFKPYVVRS